MFGEIFSFFRKRSGAEADRPPEPRNDAEPLNVAALVAPPAEAPTAPAAAAADQASNDTVRPKIVEAISTVYDPEIPVNIYELGLIYDITLDADHVAHIKMTLTSPACPSAQQLPSEVQWKVKGVEGVSDAKVQIVWDPPWTPERMSEAARMSLGMF